MAEKLSPAQELVSLRAENATLTADLESSAATLAAAQQQAKDNHTALTGMTAERDALQTSLLASEGVVTGLRSEIATLKASNATLDAAEKDLTKRANSEAARILAASGHQPVKVSNETDPGGNPGAVKTELKGRERIAAAAKAQLTKSA